jgi:hypothetical protein
MLLKHPGGRKFAELVTNHVLGDENGMKSLSVVHQKRVADKVRRHHRASRPGFDRFLSARSVHLVDLLQKMRLDEGSFLQRSSHKNQILFGNLEPRNDFEVLFQFLGFLVSRLNFFLRPSSFQNKSITGFMLTACFKSLRKLTPWTNRMMPAAAAF